MSEIDENEKNLPANNEEDGDEIYEDEQELKRGVLDEFSLTSRMSRNMSNVNPSLHSARGGVFPPPQFGAFPPPPPPPLPNFYGYPPPPPPPSFGYPPPPMPMPENMGIEYDENGNPVLVEYEYEEEVVDESDDGVAENLQQQVPVSQPPQMRPTPVFPQEDIIAKNVIARKSLKGRSVSMNDVSLLSRQREGAEKAMELEKLEKKDKTKTFVVRFFLFLVFMSAMTVGAFFVFNIIAPQHDILPDDMSNEKNLAGENYWNLKPSKANNVVMRFYEASGGVNECGAIYDKMIWGSFHIGIRIEQFYCIEKRGIAYLKVGATNESIFLLNTEGKAKRLLTPSVSGDFEIMDISETEALNGLIFFDEVLHKAAFIDYISNSHPFKDLGHMTYNGEVYDAIEFQTLSGTKISYYFDIKTNLIAYKFVEQKGVVTRVEYQDYIDFKGIKLPRIRNLSINDKPYGTAIFDTIKFNRDIIFPR